MVKTPGVRCMVGVGAFLLIGALAPFCAAKQPEPARVVRKPAPAPNTCPDRLPLVLDGQSAHYADGLTRTCENVPAVREILKEPSKSTNKGVQ